MENEERKTGRVRSNFHYLSYWKIVEGHYTRIWKQLHKLFNDI